MTENERVPRGVDPTRPSIARVYDYMLGGKDNYAVDRQVGEATYQLVPNAQEGPLANRAFLRRAVRYLAAEAGIRQFIDIGSGLPTQGNVHEIAHLVDPAAPVVYVDNDPMVLAHGRALLAEAGTTTVIQADLRQPEQIIHDPDVRRLIDFDRPIGLLMIAILHHINDGEDPGKLAAYLRDALPTGSHMVISHFYNPGDAHPDIAANVYKAEEIFNSTMGTGRWRTYDEIRGYFGDLELVEPGLVPVADWRPEPGDRRPIPEMHHTLLGGVGRKR